MGIVIIWSEFANSQLKFIFKYYKTKVSLQTAKKITSEILKEVTKLKFHTDLGQKEELLISKPENYRYLVKGNYKIIYRFDEKNNTIRVIDIFDCRQNPVKIQQSK
ncbi:type II toxin-antitoxin system RelE/ParE family toxin [Flavobacterium difficile]|uniref:Type II toxin-antitoxin system RelE/ParE family toxin n=1 Tax=Flavobacterium difficile TaxID=2709659 RepID=A0ABX0ICB5_9FLAO|nr:type II toxin-antitoxin system RelE/ParE family toxin [Flavobacterium difficile]NHM03025.1 type II toxin-antitoxin system RelE/ParE family toxin [Flavobacterium difficile]